jgi:hypothetical protein
MNFKHWFIENATLGTELVDESQIDSVYNKAKYAVKLVQMYDMTLPQKDRLLPNISMIANLSLRPDVFGLFNSKENKKVISAAAAEKIKFKFNPETLKDTPIEKIPEVIIRKYVPDLNPNDIQQSDVIHVDVRNILKRFGDSAEAIIQIASTIVHECTHEKEREETGSTKDGPGTAVEIAEEKFRKWVEKNKSMIAQRIPQIGISV